MGKEKKVTGKNISYIILGLFILSILSAFAFNQFSISNPSDSNSDMIVYHAYVCTTVTRADGTKEYMPCSHNLLYNAGKNLTRDILSGGGTGIKTIALCNASAGTGSCAAPVADGSESFVAYNACGLTNATGSYQQINANDGNWSIVATFTSSCDNRIINVTRLQNATNTIFAGNTFTAVTLQTNDQLTVNWTISIT